METLELSHGAITEEVDSIARLSSREQHGAVTAEASQPGAYVQVQGPEGAPRAARWPGRARRPGP
jgi:hypothetical protein